MDLLSVLALPFMQRAFIAGALLAILLAVLGVFATLRRMAFFGEGVAHASLAGIALAVISGLAPLPVALVWSLLVALTMFFVERKTRLPRDTVLGILFTSSMALGVILMSTATGYQADLMSYLFGSILGISQLDILILSLASVIILSAIALAFRPLILVSVNEDSARVAGIRTEATTLCLYFALAVAMVLGAKMLGIILVSALLITPAATARLVARSLRQYVGLAIIYALLAVIFGLFLSYFGDMPTGATIVLTAAALFIITALFRSR